MRSVNANDARVTNFEELKAANEFPIIRLNDTKQQKAGGPIISLNKQGDELMVFHKQIHSLILGETGSKKTLCQNAGIILSDVKAGYSVAATDVKRGELYRLLSKPLKDMGVRVRVLNLDKPELSTDGWNSCEPYAKEYAKGNRGKAMNGFTELARIITQSVKSEKDMFWENTVADSIAACMGILAHENPKRPWLCNFYNSFQLYLEGSTKIGTQTALSQYVSWKRNEIPEIETKLFATISAEGANETRSSLSAVFASAMAPVIYNSELNQLLSKSTFTAEDLVAEPSVLFIIVPDQIKALYGISSMILESLFYELIEMAERTGGCLSRNVEFVLEEFGNFPPLGCIIPLMTTSRSRRIRCHLTLQSMWQLENSYNPNIAKIIRDNSALIYMGGSEREQAEYVAKQIGKYTSHSGERKDLVTPERLLHMDQKNGEAFLLLKPMPVHTYLPVCFQYQGIEFGEVPLKKKELRRIEKFNFMKIVHDILEEKENLLANIVKDAERAKKEEKKDTNEKPSKQELPVFTPPTVPGKKAEEDSMIKFIDCEKKESLDVQLEGLFKKSEKQDKKKNEDKKEEDEEEN